MCRALQHPGVPQYFLQGDPVVRVHLQEVLNEIDDQLRQVELDAFDVSFEHEDRP